MSSDERLRYYSFVLDFFFRPRAVDQRERVRRFVFIIEEIIFEGWGEGGRTRMSSVTIGHKASVLCFLAYVNADFVKTIILFVLPINLTLCLVRLLMSVHEYR